MTENPERTSYNNPALQDTAEKILSTHFNAPIHFSTIDRLSDPQRRNLLLRCHIEADQSIPTSVIIKQVRIENSDGEPAQYNPEDLGSWDTKRFMSDWVGAEFLNTAATDARYSPQFYGGDREQGFIILEDLGSEHGSLVEPLLEGDAASAENALLHFARGLGQMHCDTAGKAEQFRHVADALHPKLIAAQQNEKERRESAAALRSKLEAFDVAIEPTFDQEMQTIIDTILDPGPFLAYIHFDPCPDNLIYRDGELHIIDFEFGQMGHALIDIAYGRMIMPTCWCCNRIPPEIVAKMETAHRTLLAQSCPQAEEDRIYDEAMAHICGFWLSNTLSWHLARVDEEDSEWGIATVRPRILARIDAFIDTAQRADLLPGFRGTVSRLRDVLHKRWPNVAPLPLYPAFRDNEI